MQIAINPKLNELPELVVSLLGATGGQLAEDDLNGRKAYQKHLVEKHK